MSGRSALLLGGSGLVGNLCLRRLLDDPTWSRVVAPCRRRLDLLHPHLEQPLYDFDALEQHADDFAVDDVFCCLGTTIKKAGSQDAFRRVDFEYPFEAARLASSRDADQFLLITSLGADREARSFYSRVKGEVEDAVKRLPFGGLHIVRPSLLVGARQELRPAEAVAIGFGQALAIAMIGPLRRYRPIAATLVADALVAIARERIRGTNVYESDSLRTIANRARRRAQR